MKTIVPMILVLSLSAPVRSAELPATVGALVNERMTMIDWGLYLLEQEFRQLTVHDHEFINVRYNRDRGKFIIAGVFYLAPEEREVVTVKDACYARVHAMKRVLGVIDTDKIHIAPGAGGRIGEKFSHSAVSSGDYDAADKLGDELLKLVYVEAKLGGDKNWFMFQHEIGCESDLLSSEVRYTGADAVR